MRNTEIEVFRKGLELSDKWLHLAILLGYIAIDHGADKGMIDQLLRKTSKVDIDKLLLERMDGK